MANSNRNLHGVFQHCTLAESRISWAESTFIAWYWYGKVAHYDCAHTNHKPRHNVQT